MASNLNQIVLDDQKQQPYQPLLGSDAVSAHSPNAELQFNLSKVAWINVVMIAVLIAALSSSWYFFRVVFTPQTNGVVTGVSSQVTFEMSLLEMRIVAAAGRAIRTYDQFTVPSVQSALLGIRACVVIALTASVLTTITYFSLAQGGLSLMLSYFVGKQWFRMYMPVVLPLITLAACISGFFALFALPPAFVDDDFLLQASGGGAISNVSGLLCQSAAVVDCSVLFESTSTLIRAGNTNNLPQGSYRSVHRADVAWWLLLVVLLFSAYAMLQVQNMRALLSVHVEQSMVSAEKEGQQNGRQK